MLRSIVNILIIAGGILFTGLVNVRLPEPWFDAFSPLISTLYEFNGIFPVDTFFNGLWIVGTVLFYFFLFKYIIGFASLIMGTGKPDID